LVIINKFRHCMCHGRVTVGYSSNSGQYGADNNRYGELSMCCVIPTMRLVSLSGDWDFLRHC
jgi:hypothetical protein